MLAGISVAGSALRLGQARAAAHRLHLHQGSTAATPYRAFTNDSWWNTPIPSSIGADARSSDMIAWMKANEPDGVKLSTLAWSMPDYMAAETDPLAKIIDTRGNVVSIHIPEDVVMMDGNDKAMCIIDLSTDQSLATFETVKVSDTTFTCTGMARYWLDSEGVAATSGGTAGNFGHRGIPGPVMDIRKAELDAGLIAHRLKCAISGPGEPDEWGWGTDPIWPMNGYEKGHGNGPPEGVVLRLKPSVDLSPVSGYALTIARCLQDYGAIVGDTSGGAAAIKLAANAVGLVPTTALQAFGWDDWEVVAHGWR